MNNWKLRAQYQGDNDSDYVEVNGYLAAPYSSEPMMRVVPFGNVYAAPLRTAASETHGPVSNQVPGICNGTFTHTGAGSATVSATTLTGEGSSATFTYSFLADGTLSTIVAASGGSNYKVGDKLRITTSGAHGSQVIEFHLVDGSNATTVSFRLIHDRQNPTPFPVHRAKCVETSGQFYFHVYDRRSSQVFPRPQDKLLDKYPNAAAAYSLRKLRSSYLGPCIRVQRSSDNALVDIGFKGDSIDLQALQDFVGEYDGRVRTFYDQSGNGNDAEQTGTSLRPNIIIGGVLQTVNGKPAMTFDGSDDSLNAGHDGLYGQDRFDAYFHIQSDDNSYIMFAQSTSGGNFSWVPEDGGSSTSLHSSYGSNAKLYVNGVDTNMVFGTNTRDQVHTVIVTDGASHSKGAIVVHEDSDTSAWTDFKISPRTNRGFDGKLTEMVIYNTDQSANRENIEKDMALYSGAYQVEDAPLLDAYGGAHAAYSLRKLNSDYTGAAVRIARDSDLAEQDIGFDADGNLDTAAALAFCPSQYGRIKIFYDQSGNGNNSTQSSQAGQPILIEQNNFVVTVNGQPALRFFGTDDVLPFDSTGLDIGNLSSFSVMKYTDTSGSEMGLSLSGTANNKRWYAPYAVATNFAYGYGATPTGITTPANTANNLHTMIAGATQGDMEAFLNGTSVGTQALVTGIDAGSTGIGNQNDNFLMNGFIQEVVVYSSDQSERRLGIERNISNHYEL